MGRKPTPPITTHPMDGVNTELIASDMAEALPLAAEREKDEVLAAGIDLGRIEAMDFILTVSNSAILSIYENIKKSKAWRLLRNPKSSHGENFRSLEEFCEVKLGKSYKRIQAIIGNRHLIGQEAFEQAERLGLRQVDYNLIKALPAPDQELVRRAVEESASKEDVLTILQELAAKAAKDQAELAKKVTEQAADLGVAEERRGVLQKRLDAAEAKAVRIARETPDERLNGLVAEAESATAGALAAVQGLFRAALAALAAHGAEHPEAEKQVRVTMQGLFARVQGELHQQRERFDLPDVANAYEAQLAAEVAQWAGNKA